MRRFPAIVESVDGQAVDLQRLAADRTVVVITLKATWCPVCQNQLVRIRERLVELEPCGITFVVLAPGPADALRAIQRRVGFDFPFVEDEDLAIAKSLGLQLADDEIVPAILMLEPDLTVGWMQQGRGSKFYGDGALVEKVACWNRV